jgi:hypothetical protein
MPAHVCCVEGGYRDHWHAPCGSGGMRARLLALIAFLLSPAPALGTPAAAADAGIACRAAIGLAEREAGIPAGLLQAIGRVESGRRDPVTGQFAPWPWTINAEGRGMYFPTREAAIAEVRQLQARGVRVIDVGCMQVNLHFHPNAFPTLEQAFDPMTNARYAAQFLTNLHGAANDWARAAGHYHSHTPERAEPYRARVLAAWAQEQGRPPGDAAAGAAALARLAAAPGGGAGPLSLTNRADRAQVIPLAAGAGGAEGRGRGLDAYRSAPIMVVGQAVAAPRPAVAAMPAAAATPPPARMAFATAPPGSATPGAGTLPITPSRPSPLAFFRRPG